ncbi:hypothetical protein [Streptomyces sp. NPDC001820]|uniref:hypothetical protein n=1 Tax=Streptomyces sp. NPDC001820 TaxID=3364613 RepID=UPI0036CEE4E6
MRPWARPTISEPAIYGDIPATDHAYTWLYEVLARLHLADRRARRAGSDTGRGLPN